MRDTHDGHTQHGYTGHHTGHREPPRPRGRLGRVTARLAAVAWLLGAACAAGENVEARSDPSATAPETLVRAASTAPLVSRVVPKVASKAATTPSAQEEPTQTLVLGEGQLPASDRLESPGRRLREPRRWRPEPVLYFVMSQDRAAARVASLEARAERRAYEGAPPVMPHSAVYGEGSRTCVDCHGAGFELGERIAHPMSHAELPNCVQCHIETDHEAFGDPGARKELPAWRGRSVPLRRASSPDAMGQPPTIPHDLAMRGRCLSCHGELGYPGLRTTHPRRAQCVQCHIPEGGPTAPFETR